MRLTRERTAMFVMSVIFCSIVSSSLSIITRENRYMNLSEATVRVKGPTEADTTLLRASANAHKAYDANMHVGKSDNVSWDSQAIERTSVRPAKDASWTTDSPRQGWSDRSVAAAMMTLIALTACALTAVGAVALLRAGRRVTGKHASYIERDTAGRSNRSKGKAQVAPNLDLDDTDQITPEDAV